MAEIKLLPVPELDGRHMGISIPVSISTRVWLWACHFASACQIM